MIRNKWIKSNRSANNGQCVEVMQLSPTMPDGTAILLRNSRDRKGGVLAYTLEEWVAFLGGVKDGDFDL